MGDGTEEIDNAVHLSRKDARWLFDVIKKAMGSEMRTFETHPEIFKLRTYLNHGAGVELRKGEVYDIAIEVR
jgi:hypothetical protein